jgi:hypothetical protein
VNVFKFRNLKNGQATPIPPGQFTIGRADDAYIHLEDPSVSRHHAQDVGSSNGTALRGARVLGRSQVQFGDVIYFGQVPFRVDPEVAGEASAAPSGGLRRVDRAYVRRATERVPLPPLGAIEKSLVAEPPSALPPDLPKDEPAKTSERLTFRPLQPVFSTPAPPERPPSSVVQERPSPVPESPFRPEPVPATDRPATARWVLIVFLAGMGIGLLLGLYFAKVFLDLGGKASMLP